MREYIVARKGLRGTWPRRGLRVMGIVKRSGNGTPNQNSRPDSKNSVKFRKPGVIRVVCVKSERKARPSERETRVREKGQTKYGHQKQ